MRMAETSYKWAGPHEYLEGLDETRLLFEARELAMKLDPDTIQDEYERRMEDDGYFDPVKK